MVELLGFFAFIVLVAAHVTWEGFALTLLWKWFVVPVFALPELLLAQAIGVALVAGFMTAQFHPIGHDTRNSFKKVADGAGWMFFHPAIALSIGFVVKQYL